MTARSEVLDLVSTHVSQKKKMKPIRLCQTPNSMKTQTSHKIRNNDFWSTDRKTQELGHATDEEGKGEGDIESCLEPATILDFRHRKSRIKKNCRPETSKVANREKKIVAEM